MHEGIDLLHGLHALGGSGTAVAALRGDVLHGAAGLVHGLRQLIHAVCRLAQLRGLGLGALGKIARALGDFLRRPAETPDLRLHVAHHRLQRDLDLLQAARLHRQGRQCALGRRGGQIAGGQVIGEAAHPLHVAIEFAMKPPAQRRGACGQHAPLHGRQHPAFKRQHQRQQGGQGEQGEPDAQALPQTGLRQALPHTRQSLSPEHAAFQHHGQGGRVFGFVDGLEECFGRGDFRAVGFGAH